MIRANNGVALIEFGLLLPILITLLVGGIEVSRFILFHQKIDNATARIADLITQMDIDNVPCTGHGGLEWMRDQMLVTTMEPYDFNQDGQLIVSAVVARYQNPNQPDNTQTLRQDVSWQWRSATTHPSRIGADGQQAIGPAWPEVFRKSPDAGGMFDGERVIAVEVFYNYSLLLPGMNVLIPESNYRDVHKTAFYRARFSNLSNLANDC